MNFNVGQFSWSMTCLQAIWISDAVLGARSVETRAAFIVQLQAECIEATTEDLQHLVKPAKEGPSVASAVQKQAINQLQLRP